MSDQKQKKSPSKAKGNHKKALTRSFLISVCLEFIRQHGAVRATARKLEISHHTLYEYMDHAEWAACLETAQRMINEEMTRSMVLERGMLDFAGMQQLNSLQRDPEALAEFRRLLQLLYKTLGYGLDAAPQIGISATASAQSTIEPAGKDAFQIYEAKWLTKKKEVWGEALTQKVRAYLAASIQERDTPPAPLDGDSPPKAE